MIEEEFKQELDEFMVNGDFSIPYNEDVVRIVSHMLDWQKRQMRFKMPHISKREDVSVTSRLQYIDEDLKPIADFVIDYAGWNLDKNEHNRPILEVPLYRVLDALAQRGKPYCEG